MQNFVRVLLRHGFDWRVTSGRVAERVGERENFRRWKQPVAWRGDERVCEEFSESKIVEARRE